MMRRFSRRHSTLSLSSSSATSSESDSDETSSLGVLSMPVLHASPSEAFTTITDVPSFINARYSISILQSAGVICVFDELLDNLEVLKNIDVYFEKIKVPLRTVPFDERFDPDSDYEPYPSGPFVDLEGFKRHKVRSTLVQIMTKVKEDLLSLRSFLYLRQRLSDLRLQLDEEIELSRIYEANQKSLNDLYGMRFNLEEMRAKALREKSSAIHKNAREHQDWFFEMLIKERYVTNWENSRAEQSETISRMAEEKLQKDLEKFQLDTIREQRIHEEIMAYLRESQDDFEELTDHWMNKHQTDVELIDTEISVLREKRDKQFERLETLSKLYHTRQKDIKTYTFLQSDRDHSNRLSSLVYAAATMIQAWWKGQMVRKRMGIYARMFKRLEKERRQRLREYRFGKKAKKKPGALEKGKPKKGGKGKKKSKKQ